MKRSILKSALACGLGLALTLGSFSMVHAAGLKLVSKTLSNDGETVSYTYNKKGLLAKSVTKSTSSTNAARESRLGSNNIATDLVTTETTIYKYNKNNKVDRRTTTSVTDTTYYQMDQTGLNKIADLGTITTTINYVTDFSYNKKGLASKAVTTITTGMSGTASYTADLSIVTMGEDEYQYQELSDGRIIAGYNPYDKNGDPVFGENIENAFFLMDAPDKVKGTRTYTMSYTDNGNGSFRQERKVDTVMEGYLPVASYEYYGNNRIQTGVTIEADPAGNYTESSNIAIDLNMKSVKTTKYTYDKNKRIIKAETTDVEYVDDVRSISYSDTTNRIGDSYTETTITSSIRQNSLSEVDTNTETTTYSYDKNGRVSRTVTSKGGVINYTNTETEYYTPEESIEVVKTYTDGRPTEHEKFVTLISNSGNTTHSVSEGGNRTDTPIYEPYTVTEIENGNVISTTSWYWDPRSTQEDKWTEGTGPAYTDTAATETLTETATPSRVSAKYIYDSKGNLKTVKTDESQTEEYTVINPTYGNKIYEVDKKGKVVEKKKIRTVTTSKTDNYEKTSPDRNTNVTVMRETEKKNRSEKSAFTVNYRRSKFKSKSISSKAYKAVKNQQWIINNPLPDCVPGGDVALNGEIGLKFSKEII